MAFGKKKDEPKLVPMAAYDDSLIKSVKNCITGDNPYQELPLDWQEVRKIMIDRVAIIVDVTSNGRDIRIMSDDVPGDYLRAWRKGLGKFIRTDLRKLANLDKYKFIVWDENDTSMGALIREIMVEDKKPEEGFSDLKEYNAINFSYFDEINSEHYFQILKVYTDLKDLNDIEYKLSASTRVFNPNDPYSEDNMIENEDAQSDTSDMPLILDSNLSEEYINQFSLF